VQRGQERRAGAGFHTHRRIDASTHRRIDASRE
jgi:hypothetical protein